MLALLDTTLLMSFLTIYNLLGQYSFQEVIFLNGANDFLSLTYSSKKKMELL